MEKKKNNIKKKAAAKNVVAEKAERKAPMPVKKSRLGFWVVICVLLYIFIEIASFAAFSVLKNSKGIRHRSLETTLTSGHRETLAMLLGGKVGYLGFSPELGWSVKANGSSPLYRADSNGIRGDLEHSVEPADGVVRVSTFGDSFTHCDDVKNSETWQANITSARPGGGLEFLNFGVPGYGLDQAYLRYLRQGRKFNSDIVLIGYMSEDINRHLSVFRPFYAPKTFLPLSKPRYKIEDGALVLKKNPIRKLSTYRRLLKEPAKVLRGITENEYYLPARDILTGLGFLPSVRLVNLLRNNSRAKSLRADVIKDGEYNIDSEAFRVTARIFDEFYASAIRDGAKPIIITFPHVKDVHEFRKGKAKSYAPLLAHFDKKKYRYIDIMDIFAGVAGEKEVKKLREGHYRAETNKVVGAYIGSYLEENGFIAVATKP